MLKNLCIFISLLFFHGYELVAYTSSDDSQGNVYLVDFKFDKRDLKDILNEFAHLRGINILYSSTIQLNAKVSFDAGKKITFMKAWELLLMMLEQAGFSLIHQGQDMYALISSDLVNTTPLPIYINTDPGELPVSQERIRYVYYFKDITLSTQQGELTTVLKNFFDPKTFNQQLVFEPNFNAMIITAKAETIKSVMKFIDIFDQPGEKQVADIFNLKFASSVEVASILTNLILGQDGSKSKSAQKPLPSTESALMFSPSTKVVSLFGGVSALGSSSAVEYGNAIVILGKKSDVELVKKFIKDHLDVPIEQGRSFFHVVEPQWLRASELQTIIQDLVMSPSGSGQSTSVNLSNLAFDPQIKIVSENVSLGASTTGGELAQSLASGVQNTVQRGSNKLIIAATNKDWHRIEDVIKKLDIPQKQVIIEALILDLSIIFTHKLASQIRTNGLSASIFPKNMQAQAAMLFDAIPTDLSRTDDATLGIEGDLSNILTFIGLPAGADQTAKSTIFMIGDKQTSNGIWAFFQLLSLHSSSKTISRAFVVAQNNMPATVTHDISKRLPGALTAGTTATVKYQQVNASVKIHFTPLISTNNIVNLQMEVDATYWNNPVDGTDGRQTSRYITTNFSLKDGQVAILGGLTRNQTDEGFNGVPLLSKIPVIGPLLFSSKRHTEDKTKLFMVVRTTVTQPRHEGGMGKVTRRMAAVANHNLDSSQGDDELFSSIKDPISRWIFDDNSSSINNGLPLHDLFMKSHNVNEPLA